MRKETQVQTDHHVHGPTWLLRFETGKILELVISNISIVLKATSVFKPSDSGRKLFKIAGSPPKSWAVKSG